MGEWHPFACAGHVHLVLLALPARREKTPPPPPPCEYFSFSFSSAAGQGGGGGGGRKKNRESTIVCGRRIPIASSQRGIPSPRASRSVGGHSPIRTIGSAGGTGGAPPSPSPRTTRGGGRAAGEDLSTACTTRYPTTRVGRGPRRRRRRLFAVGRADREAATLHISCHSRRVSRAPPAGVQESSAPSFHFSSPRPLPFLPPPSAGGTARLVRHLHRPLRWCLSSSVVVVVAPNGRDDGGGR